MPSIILSNEQVVELVKQLPQEQKIEIFRFLLISQWQEWQHLSSYGIDKVKLAAKERGRRLGKDVRSRKRRIY